MTENRRPIKTRQSAKAQEIAARLVASDITPNQISAASIGFAALAGALLWGSAHVGWFGACLLLILAIAAVQGRLLCNLFDGMVAVEGGKSAPDGPFWNEAPDRAADILILWGAGAALGRPALGLMAAVLAVTTAYLRELGRAEGQVPDFSGPMAKQHRMAVISLGSGIAALELLVFGTREALWIALWVVILGALITIWRRARRIVTGLSQRP